MKCKTCQYPLWNIRARVCPECGSGFKPSDFDFVPSTVRFCCPSCSQPYYGTDDRGHLVPKSFDCVKCGHPVEMDETVLLPTEGVDEAKTQQDGLAWERPELGGWKRYWSTCGQALVLPHKLGAMLAQEGTPGRATRFFLWTQTLVIIGSVLPFIGLLVVALIITTWFEPLSAPPALRSGTRKAFVRIPRIRVRSSSSSARPRRGWRERSSARCPEEPWRASMESRSRGAVSVSRRKRRWTRSP